MYIKRVKLINQDCLPILMLLYIILYIMHAYLMLFVCIVLFFHLFQQMLSVFMLCLGLLTHSLFISCVDLHHAQCFYTVGFS